MTRRYFGTDGIRGRANSFPMTAEVAMKVGMAAGTSFQRGSHRHRVVIGKDTRLSGYMLENAIVVPIMHVNWIISYQDKVKGTKFHSILPTYKLIDTWID